MARPTRKKSLSRPPSRKTAAGIDWSSVPLKLGAIGTTRIPSGVHRRAAFEANTEASGKGLRFNSEAKSRWKLADQDLWIFCEGHADMRLGKKYFKAAPGTCLWLRPGVESQLEWTVTSRADLVTHWIHFDTLLSPGGVPFVPESSQLPPMVAKLADVDYVVTLASRLVSRFSAVMLSAAGEASESSLWGPSAILRLLLLEYWGSVHSGSSEAGTPLRHRRAVSDVVDEIQRDPVGHKEFALMAARRGYQAKYFARIFREVTGQRPSDFIIHCRISRAKDLLLHTDLTVSAVADLCGYNSFYFFSRQFKQLTGVTPSYWRKQT